MEKWDPAAFGKPAETPFKHYCKTWTPRHNVLIGTNFWPDWSTFVANKATHEDFHVRNSSLSAGEKFRVENCIQDDYWYAERAGPMVSTGGHDFWISAWRSGIHEAYGDAAGGVPLAVQSTEVGPVDPSGHFIPYPPIHLHHTHWMQDWGDSEACIDVDQSDKNCLSECFLTGKNCYTLADGSAMVNAHGDWQKNNGPDYPNFVIDFTGSEMILTASRLNHFYMLDDVRPAGAPQMKFYAFAAMKLLKPGTQPERPGSRLTADNWWDATGKKSVEHHDGINVISRVETKWYGESWSYFSFRTPFAGELIPESTMLHTHMNGFHLSLMVRGLPSGYLPAEVAGLRPIGTDTVIYRHPDVVQAALEKLSANWDNDDRLMCEIKPNFDWGVGYGMIDMKIDNHFQYDRMGITRCRTGFRFKDDEVFTAIATHGQVGEVAENTMIHTNWNLRYWADDGLTHTTTTSGAYSDEPLRAYDYAELGKFVFFIAGKGDVNGVSFVSPSWLTVPRWVIYGPVIVGAIASALFFERPTRGQRVGCILVGIGVSLVVCLAFFSYNVPILAYIMRDQPSQALLKARDGAIWMKRFALRTIAFTCSAGVLVLGYILMGKDGRECDDTAIPHVSATPHSKSGELV